uniref:Uncharacterized protein n=1 Tax=Rhizophora mucronata TaxID=61149 RepID=A0A2P2IUM1_RHIMU
MEAQLFKNEPIAAPSATMCVISMPMAIPPQAKVVSCIKTTCDPALGFHELSSGGRNLRLDCGSYWLRHSDREQLALASI